MTDTFKLIRSIILYSKVPCLWSLVQTTRNTTQVQRYPIITKQFFWEMSSWTAFAMHIGMKTTFQTKYIKSKYVPISIMMIFGVLLEVLIYKPLFWSACQFLSSRVVFSSFLALHALSKMQCPKHVLSSSAEQTLQGRVRKPL